MASNSQTKTILFQCFDDLERLLPTLTDDQWSTPSLCPDWDVRGVVSHLAGVEHVLTGWRPDGPDAMPPFDRVGPFIAGTGDDSNDEMRDRTVEILTARRADLEAMTDDDFDSLTANPVGVGPYRRFMEVRIFDFWVHQRDITTPLGISTDDGGPAAEMVLDEIQGSMGYIVGKLIGLADGLSIRFEVTGPAKRTINVAVDGRAGLVDMLGAPTVTVSADTVSFVQLACGRIDPEQAIAEGRISWSGDDHWGRRAATNLRFTR